MLYASVAKNFLGEACNGLLSQVILNLRDVESRLNSVAIDLPPSVCDKQFVQFVIKSDIDSLVDIQSLVGHYCVAAIVELEEVLNRVREKNYADVYTITKTITLNTNLLKSRVDIYEKKIAASGNDLCRFINNLNQIKLAIEQERASLSADAEYAESQYEKYEKEKKYFLALGIFGLPGLAIALPLLSKWEQKANTCQANLRNIENRMFMLSGYVAVMELVANENRSVVNQISKIVNAVDILECTMDNIIKDLETQLPELAELYLTVAVSEVKTLQADAF